MIKYIFILLALVLSERSYAQEVIFLAPPEDVSDIDNGIMPKDYLHQVFEHVAKEVGVPEKLIRAICYSESHFNIDAYNHSDGKGTNHAFGVCQILRKTAEERGFKDPHCSADFSDRLDASGKLIKKSRTYKDCKLFGEYTNIYYASKYLKEKLDQYNGSWISAIAAYNTGTVRICKKGYVTRLKDHSVISKCRIGHLLNETYVNKVLVALGEDR